MKRLFTIGVAAFLVVVSARAELERIGNLDGGVALHGYDPVSYFTEKKPSKGKKDFVLDHQGAKFLFASAENLKKFQADPSNYEAAYGGWCAYAMADGEKVDIDPETYKIVDGKLLLFYNGWLGNTLKKWNPKETELKPKADEAWKKVTAEKKS